MLDGEVKSKHTGRPLGKANLSDEVKVGILTEKKLQLISQSQVAEQFGVSRRTVNVMSEDDLSPQAKVAMQEVVESQTFADKLRKAREKTIDNINVKLENDDFKDGVYPNLLNAINSNYRLETNQSTANVSVASVLDRTLQGLRDIGWTDEQLEAVRNDPKLLAAAGVSEGE